jgi:paraquat-inducible protein B
MSPTPDAGPDPSPEPGNSLPTPDVHARRLHFSLVWLVPLVAALVGIGLVIRSQLQSGPMIRIEFQTAEGIDAGKTEVKYKNVVIGRVRTTELGPNYESVYVNVELSREAAELAVDDTRFWVVRPRADLGGVSGLGTILSGAYIGVDVGHSAKPRTQFVGLEKPPAITSEQKGRRFLLSAPDLGSLNIGAPIYYRRIPVGRVAGYDLREDGSGVTLQVFVDRPYDRFVTDDTRFWNASGVDISINSSGVKVASQSLATIVAGGLAFESRSGDPNRPAAAEGSQFQLFDDRNTALAPPDGASMIVHMPFDQSTRGLSVGSTVDFRGVDLGKVESIGLTYDPQRKSFTADVVATLFPERLGRAYRALGDSQGMQEPDAEALFAELVRRGLRSQLRTGNLVTGQLYVALDFVPNAKPAQAELLADGGLSIPSSPGSLDQIQEQILSIVEKMNAVPFERIGSNLADTLGEADRLLKTLSNELAPEARKTLTEAQQTLDAASKTLSDRNAPLQQDAASSLRELERAARSLRTLADYLQRHPQALLFGKPSSERETNDR